MLFQRFAKHGFAASEVGNHNIGIRVAMFSVPILDRLQDCEDRPHTRRTVEKFQRALGVRLPKDYAEFLLQFNGGYFRPFLEFDLPHPPEDCEVGILDSFLGDEDGKFDKILDWTNEFSEFIPEPCVPIAYCATGDFIVLKFTLPDSKFDGVWFWDRRADPERGEQILHPVADSFTEFLSMLRVFRSDEEVKERETLPTFQAVERGELTAIERYLAEGGNPNRRNAKGQTLLAAAAIYSWPKIVRLLLENSADPNARDRKGRTPLHHAADSSLDSVKLLLAAGADAKARDNKGNSVLPGWPYRADRLLRAHGAEE
jgi:hypothetical protein